MFLLKINHTSAKTINILESRKKLWMVSLFGIVLNLLVCSVFYSSGANAIVGTMDLTVPANCTDSVGWYKKIGNVYCFPDDNYYNYGVNILKASTLFGVQPVGMGADFYGFVPKSGFYRLRTHGCSTAVAIRCSLSSSTIFWDSPHQNVYFRSGMNFNLQDGGFGTVQGTVPENTALCLTLVDSQNKEWGLPGKFFCAGAQILPDTPTSCKFNSGEALNVDMGSIERSTIGTAPGTTPTVKKTLQVLCTGDAAITSNIQFQFTPLSVNGSSVVQSSSNGLGVAIIYKGSAVKPTDVFTQSYESGITPLDLEFEAVRDPKVAIGSIPTGKFSANAVMVVTQQ